MIDALSAPNCSLANAARLIQLEPMLSAKVVALSNAVVYNRSGRTITSVQDAVQLIGLRMLKTLAISVVMRQMASGAAGGRGPLATRLWDHSVHVAALAYVIARRVTGQPAEAAMSPESSTSSVASVSCRCRRTSSARTTSSRLAWARATAAIRSQPPCPKVSRNGLDGRCCRRCASPEPIIEAVAVTWRGPADAASDDAWRHLDARGSVGTGALAFEDASGAERADQAGIDAVIGREALVDLLEEAEALIRSLLGALNA